MAEYNFCSGRHENQKYVGARRWRANSDRFLFRFTVLRRPEFGAVAFGWVARLSMIGTKPGTTISARLEGKQYSARQIWVDVPMYALHASYPYSCSSSVWSPAAVPT